MAKWYFLIDGEEFGPVESAVLRRIAGSGRLKPQDKVRREDMAEWHEAKQVKGLFAAVQPTATAASAPIRNAPQAKRNVTTKMPPPAPNSASHVAKPTNKPAFNSKVLIALLGVILFLLVLLIPAIQSARDEVSGRNASQKRAEVERLLASARQTLSVNIPRPVHDALASGNEAWALNDYLPVSLGKVIPKQPYTFYVIMSDGKPHRGIFAADRPGAGYEEVNLHITPTEEYGTSTTSVRSSGNLVRISTVNWFVDVHLAPEKRAIDTAIYINADTGEGFWTRKQITTGNKYDLWGGKFTKSGTETKKSVFAGKAFTLKQK